MNWTRSKSRGDGVSDDALRPFDVKKLTSARSGAHAGRRIRTGDGPSDFLRACASQPCRVRTRLASSREPRSEIPGATCPRHIFEQSSSELAQANNSLRHGSVRCSNGQVHHKAAELGGADGSSWLAQTDEVGKEDSDRCTIIGIWAQLGASGVIGEGREAAERGHVYDTEADANRFGWGDLTTPTPTTTTAATTSTPTYVRAPFSRRGAFFFYFWRGTVLWALHRGCALPPSLGLLPDGSPCLGRTHDHVTSRVCIPRPSDDDVLTQLSTAAAAAAAHACISYPHSAQRPIDDPHVFRGIPDHAHSQTSPPPKRAFCPHPQHAHPSQPCPFLPRAFSIFSSTATGRIFPSRFPDPARPSRAWTAHSPKHLPCPHIAGRPSTENHLSFVHFAAISIHFPFSHSQVATLPSQRTGSATKPTKPRRDPDAARSLSFPLAQPELEPPEPKLHGQDKVVPFAPLREPHSRATPCRQIQAPPGPLPPSLDLIPRADSPRLVLSIRFDARSRRPSCSPRVRRGRPALVTRLDLVRFARARVVFANPRPAPTPPAPDTFPPPDAQNHAPPPCCSPLQVTVGQAPSVPQLVSLAPWCRPGSLLCAFANPRSMEPIALPPEPHPPPPKLSFAGRLITAQRRQVTTAEALFPSPHLPTPAAPGPHGAAYAPPSFKTEQNALSSQSAPRWSVGQLRARLWAGPRAGAMSGLPGPLSRRGPRAGRGGVNVRGTKRRITETYTPATRQPRAGRCAACEIPARGTMYVYQPITKYVHRQAVSNTRNALADPKTARSSIRRAPDAFRSPVSELGVTRRSETRCEAIIQLSSDDLSATAPPDGELEPPVARSRAHILDFSPRSSTERAPQTPHLARPSRTFLMRTSALSRSPSGPARTDAPFPESLIFVHLLIPPGARVALRSRDQALVLSFPFSPVFDAGPVNHSIACPPHKVTTPLQQRRPFLDTRGSERHTCLRSTFHGTDGGPPGSCESSPLASLPDPLQILY
ncbi:hypothetical protein HETIRDRAFT_453486 [Heterobasidion irregulare TC 32-1]|uniref:Uncharacterized protein n=1 Tax=Heterobasidion irregulare (strain TC 32-1) TaxID=747525 RepID=W4JZH3_HETIT|nr:uncharacterized protein HETIRDRAFT_453486 [Heterobasidion irregulare TC 32-1]ETW78947.1 hypothetical protein HETIRDRAFT_453486 [Heterobasidion irregulare TC 32-1]